MIHTARVLPAAAIFALAACHSSPPPGETESPSSSPASRSADLSLLRLGQPFLDGALEVTRFSSSRPGGRLTLAVTVANRSGSSLKLRCRWRFVDPDGFERRTRDSAQWTHVDLAAGSEWKWEGEGAVPEALAAGMDWRFRED